MEQLVCQNPACLSGGGWQTSSRPDRRAPRNEAGRAILEYSGAGRKPRYCSDACKQQDWRERKAINDRLAARQARERADEAYMRQLVYVVEQGLVNVKLSTTQRKAVATGIANAVARVTRSLPGLS